LQAQWAAAEADLQPKLDAVAPAPLLSRQRPWASSAQAAQEATHELERVSMFISRKTKTLHVRRAFQPIWESPVTILNSDRPMGTSRGRHLLFLRENSRGNQCATNPRAAGQVPRMAKLLPRRPQA
jgi:hypothetical protein